MFHFLKQYLNGRHPPEINPTSLGNIMIGMGIVYRGTLEKVVALQQQFKNAPPEEFLIGELLVREGHISRDQLAMALLRQKQMRGEKVNFEKASEMVYESLKSQIDQMPKKLEELTKLADEAVQAHRK